MNRSRCLCAHLMMVNEDPTSHHFSQCFDIEPLTALFTSSLRVLHLADPARMFESYCPIFALENHALASNICWESSQCRAISWGMIICIKLWDLSTPGYNRRTLLLLTPQLHFMGPHISCLWNSCQPLNWCGKCLSLPLPWARTHLRQTIACAVICCVLGSPTPTPLLKGSSRVIKCFYSFTITISAGSSDDAMIICPSQAGSKWELHNNKQLITTWESNCSHTQDFLYSGPWCDGTAQDPS